MNTPGLSTVRVDVDKALLTIRGNRKKHEDQYRRAYRGWLQEAIEKVGDIYNKLDDELNSNEITPIDQLQVEGAPRNHLDDYDRVISILEWTEDPIIELTQQEFDMYIRDEWTWKHNFAVSASKYGA